MNVIFLDFDGVINTLHSNLRPYEDEGAKERRVKILGDICKLYDCKIVIESSHKYCINEETLETNVDWINELFDLFKKYDIEVIGVTPFVRHEYMPIWKEDEIIEYIRRHPEIERFCVLDDDDLVSKPNKKKGDFSRSDLNKVRDYLVSPIYYDDYDYTKSGLLESHIEEVGKILEKEIDYDKLGIKRKTR